MRTTPREAHGCDAQGSEEGDPAIIAAALGVAAQGHRERHGREPGASAHKEARVAVVPVARAEQPAERLVAGG
jgi:hypothetical protein